MKPPWRAANAIAVTSSTPGTVRDQGDRVKILVLGAVPSRGGLHNPGFAVPLGSRGKPDRKWT